MVCNKCGQQNNDGSKFCYSCGSLLENTQPQQGNNNQLPKQQGDANQSSMWSNSEQSPKQVGVNYKNAQASVDNEPVAVSAPTYASPAESAPAYTAPTASAPVYTPPGAPSAPAYANPPVYPSAGVSGTPSSAKPGLGMAIAGMVCGICSIMLLYIGMIPGALGIIFGSIAKNNGSDNPMATAGIICGAIGIFLSLIWVVICAVAIS